MDRDAARSCQRARGRSRARIPRVVAWVLTITVCASIGAASTALLTRASAASQMRAATAYVTAWAGSIDLTHLTLGDGKVTTAAPKRGWVYSCGTHGDPMGGPGGGGAPMKGAPMKGGPAGGGPAGQPGANVVRPWIHGTTWNYLEKAKVTGGVRWASNLRVQRSGAQRVVTGNGLPSHATGVFPIRSTDPAAAFDPNPNKIGTVNIALKLPVRPAASATPNCVPQGPIGVMNSGAVLFNALDAEGHDAVAREMQDGCSGHPQERGMYHYHSLPACLYSGRAGVASSVIGWAVDGYPITGPRGPKGTTFTNAMLDACHGTTSPIVLDGKVQRVYHYVATMQFPYTIGCLRGKSVLPNPGGAGVAGGGPQAQGGGAPMKGQPTVDLSRYTGQAFVTALSVAYRWLGTGWQAVSVTAGQAYVMPYSGKWMQIYTQSTGWLVIDSHLLRP